MRHHSLLLALAATIGIAGPALAESGSPVVGDTVILHNLTPSQVACKPDACHDKDCKDKDCETHGTKTECHDKDCKDKDCETHGTKTECHDKDCKDEACKTHGTKSDCDADCEDGHGRNMVRREVREYRYHGHMGGMMHPAKAFRLGYQWNAPTGRGYTMVGMDRLFGPETCHTWWNPKMGPSVAYGMDLGDMTNTRHLGYGGWLAQNAFHFGPVTVTAGVVLGGGLNVDVTPTITFQNYNGFFLADPRLSVGWQVTPRMAVSVAGNYLLTTRPAAIGGAGAALQFSYGF